MISKVLSSSPTGQSGDSTCPSHSMVLEDDTSNFQKNCFPKVLETAHVNIAFLTQG